MKSWRQQPAGRSTSHQASGWTLTGRCGNYLCPLRNAIKKADKFPLFLSVTTAPRPSGSYRTYAPNPAPVLLAVAEKSDEGSDSLLCPAPARRLEILLAHSSLAGVARSNAGTV